MADKNSARLGPARLALLLALAIAAACGRASAPEGSLTFKRDGRTVRTVTLAALSDQHELRTVETNDPYYGKHKRFRALSLQALLSSAYGEPPERLRERGFMLYALDGYAVPIEGKRLIDSRAFVAIDDVDVPGFAPIGPRQVSPAPAYLIWQGNELTDLETHPRPWQLATVDIVDVEALYPHTVPTGEPKDGSAMRGYHLFRERCIRCHAINREGGNVGPELNVPQSIVAYRPEAQIRAYILDPLTFRYGAMPANPDLDDAQLDSLIAYFRAMATRPYDPAKKPDP